jgi:hypothetical protein
MRQRWQRPGLNAAILLALTGAVIGCGLYLGLTILESPYWTLSQGMTYEEVVSCLGTPEPFNSSDDVSSVGSNRSADYVLTWDRGQITLYVWFADNHRVVDKGWYIGRSVRRRNWATVVRQRLGI